MKFSELEDGEDRLARFRSELQTVLNLERQERRSKEWQKWADRMPWIVAGMIGWSLFFLSLLMTSTGHFK